MAATPDLRLQAGPHVFVEDVRAPTLSDQDRHHLAKSLRLRDGDPLTVSDGRGRWCTAVFGSALEPTGTPVTVPDPAYEVSLGIALTKTGKPEFAVQKATELGIDHILVFAAEHSVARWDEDKRAKNLPRLERVAREAAMQSRRVTIPSITIEGSLDDIVAQNTVARADFVATTTISTHRCVVVGPEGGWSERERHLITDVVDLGPTVLRAETAAVVTASALTSSRNLSQAG